MLIRLLLLGLAVGAAGMLWWKFRPDPLQKVPPEWRALGRSDADFRRGLQARRAVAALVSRGLAEGAGGLLGEVDAMLRSLARLVEARSALRDVSVAVPSALNATITRVTSALEAARDSAVVLVGQQATVGIGEAEATLRDARSDVETVIESHQELESWSLEEAEL